jgi:hypothetical protein
MLGDLAQQFKVFSLVILEVEVPIRERWVAEIGRGVEIRMLDQGIKTLF